MPGRVPPRTGTGTTGPIGVILEPQRMVLHPNPEGSPRKARETVTKTRLFLVAAAFNLGLFTLAQTAGPASEGVRSEASGKPVGYRAAKFGGGEGAT